MKETENNQLDETIDLLSNTDFMRFDSLFLAFQNLTKTLADGLSVNRVSIWGNEPEELVCRCLYDKKTNGFVSGDSMFWADYPKYYHELEKGGIIIAPDASKNKFTKDLVLGFEPSGTRAMLDIPLILNGKFIGALSCEQLGSNRVWTKAEITLAKYAASLISLIEGNFILKATENQLSQERTLLKTIVDNIPVRVFVKDRQSRRILSNKEDRKFLERKEDNEVLGVSTFELFDRKSAELILEQDKNIFKTRKSVLGKDIIYNKKDGTQSQLIVSKIPLIEKNEVTGLIGITIDVTERAKNNEKLKQSEEKLRFITENTSDGVLTIHNNVITFYSKACERILGYSFLEVNKILQEDPMALIHPDDVANSTEILKSAIERKDTHFLMVHRARHKNGHYFWRENSISLIFDEEGKLDHSILIIRDITERVEQNELLLKNTEQLKFIAENTSDGVFLIDSNYELSYYSKTCQKISGYSFEEIKDVCQGNWLALAHPDESPKLEKKISDTIKSKSPHLLIVHRSRHKKGYYFWRESSINILYDKKGEFGSAIFVVRDVTEKVKSEEHFKLITENTSDGIMVTNGAGKLTYYAPNCELITGYNAEESRKLNTKSWLNLVHSDDRNRIKNELTKVLVNKAPHFFSIHRIKMKNAIYRWLECSMNFLYDDSKRVSNVITIMRDVTERKENEALLIKNETQLRFISDNTSDGIMVIEHGLLSYYSKTCQNISGYSFDEMFNFIEKDIFTLVHPNEQSKVNTAIGLAVNRKQRNVLITNKCVHKDGHYFWCENSINFIYNEDNSVKQTVLVSRDVTERIEAEQKTYQNQRKLNGILNALNEAVWAISLPDESPLFVSKSFEKLFGFNFEEWKQDYKLWEKVVHKEDKHLIPSFKVSVSKGKRTTSTVRINSGNGVKWVETILKVVKGKNGSAKMVIGIGIDRTSQKDSEEKLKRARKLAITAEKNRAELELRTLQMQLNPHFIFNALNSIQSFILKNDVISTNDYLSKFANLIRSFLDSSRSVSISLHEEIRLIKLYVGMEQMRFEDKFDFSLTINPDVDKTFELPSMLLQPFVENAINHGIRYKKGKGFLKINIDLKDGVILCHIKDDGVGREAATQILKNTNKGYISQGMKITAERFETYNAIHGTKLSYEVSDLYTKEQAENEEVGTHVLIKFLPGKNANE